MNLEILFGLLLYRYPAVVHITSEEFGSPAERFLDLDDFGLPTRSELPSLVKIVRRGVFNEGISKQSGATTSKPAFQS